MKRYLDSIKGDFHLRQTVMLGLAVLLVIFLVFYWTWGGLSSWRADIVSEDNAAKAKIAKVTDLMVKIKDKERNSKVLTTGLQSYIQGLGGKLRLESKIVNIKLVSNASRLEQVSFRAENLVYKDYITLLGEFEQYDNVVVKNMAISKRYDNPNRIDVTWDVVRNTQ